MKRTKKLWILTIAAMMLLLCACSQKANPLIGSWHLDVSQSSSAKIEFDGLTRTKRHDASILHIFEDGTWEMLDENGVLKAVGSYSIILDGSAVSLIDASGRKTTAPIYFKVLGRVLVFTQGSSVLMYILSLSD